MISPQWLDLEELLIDLKVTSWFQLVICSIGSTTWIASLANISVISWSFFKIFLLKIGLISAYKMPRCLPCYLIRVLRYSSGKIGILAATRKLPHYVCMMSLLRQFKPCPQRLIIADLAILAKI